MLSVHVAIILDTSTKMTSSNPLYNGFCMFVQTMYNIHICMYVCNVSTYEMYVCNVMYVCMYVCNVSTYEMYVCM